jgi:predicted Zn-dependent protease
MYFKLGQHFDRNSFELAAREFERVLELEPTRIAAIVNLGETYTLMGRSQDARALYERGLQRFNPGSENWQMLQQRLQQK